MPRKPTSIPGIGREVVPIAPQSECVGMCMDVNCQRCWDDFFASVLAPDLWHLPAVPPLRVVVEMGDARYAARDEAATGLGVTIEEAAAAVLREWADRQRR
jgi:hypothetical protein